MKLAVTSALILSLIAASFADSLSDTVHKVNRGAAAAILHKDPKGMDNAIRPYVTKDFKYTEDGRTMGYKEMVQHLSAGLNMLQHVKSAAAQSSGIREHGSTGTSRTVHRITASVPGADRKPHTLVMIGTSADTWVKVGGAWKMKTMHWLGQKVTLDGKPMNLGAPKDMGTPNKLNPS